MRRITIPNFLKEAADYLVTDKERSGARYTQYFARNGFKILVAGEHVNYIEEFKPDEDDADMGRVRGWEIVLVDNDFDFTEDSEALRDFEIIQVIETSVF
jgi:hypothetical protein